MLLSFAGLERRDLGCVVALLSAAGEFLDDLRAAGRELADHRARDVRQLGHALAWLVPFDAERTGELGAELSLVEVAGGEPVALEDRLAVERTPRAVARGLRHVRDDHVGVEVRVLRPARAVLIGGRDEPAGVLAMDAVAAATGHARLVFEVAERRLPRRQVRLVDCAAGLLVAERVEEADALRRREDEVEPGDRREPLRLDAGARRSAGRSARS